MILSLLERIQTLQSPGDQFFAQGHFPAYRYYPYLNLRRADDNLFFTALTTSLLQFALASQGDALKSIIRTMESAALENYPSYRVARNGIPVYQFWKEGQNYHFPNGWLLHRFKKFKSPPDTDDTALAYLTFPHQDQEVEGFRSYLAQFANGQRKWNHKIPAEFNRAKVYSTWMGTGAMPIEFDVVVMSNLLRVFNRYQLTLNEFDRATLEYLTEMIDVAFYMKQPFYAAPWYPSAVIIHYHMVKLMWETQWPVLVAKRGRLQKQLQFLQKASCGFMERILMQSSALRLEMDPSVFREEKNEKTDFQDFTFYIGGMLTAMSSKWSWYLAKNPVFHWQFKCPAFCYALILELEVLKKSLR